jgi:hypothetical protein
MYISITVLIVLVYMWISNLKELKAANQRVVKAEKRASDLERLNFEAGCREISLNSKLSQPLDNLRPMAFFGIPVSPPHSARG